MCAVYSLRPTSITLITICVTVQEGVLKWMAVLLRRLILALLHHTQPKRSFGNSEFVASCKNTMTSSTCVCGSCKLMVRLAVWFSITSWGIRFLWDYFLYMLGNTPVNTTHLGVNTTNFLESQIRMLMVLLATTLLCVVESIMQPTFQSVDSELSPQSSIWFWQL